MNLLNRMRFRWDNSRDPLPGELAPTEAGAVIVYMTEPEDVENILLFRRLRAVITGYGPGWTFAEALLDWGFPKLWLAVFLIGLWVLWQRVVG